MTTFRPAAADRLLDYATHADLDGGIKAKTEHRKLRYIDRIWRITGKIPLAPGQSSNDAFDRLDSLFHEPGTSYARMGDTLTFSKKDQPAQDKMSVFDSGVLTIEQSEAESVLRYDLFSRALIFCFLMPLFFLGMSQAMIAVGDYHRATAKAEAKAKAASAKKKAEPEKAALPLNPIDVALGAPAPEKKDKKKAEQKLKDMLSPTPAYVLAGIFAALYLIGRLLEDWLVSSVFRKRLLE